MDRVVSTTSTTGTNTGSIGLNLTNKGTIADVAGNALSATTPVVGQAYNFDTTAPTVTAVVLGNGGVGQKVDNGDTAMITFSEKLDASLLCSSWTNVGTQSITNATITFTDSGGNDTFAVTATASPSCTSNGKFGTLNTAGDYVGGGGGNALVFTGSTITWDPTANTHRRSH